MTNGSKVLACVDQSRFALYVADYAAWAAIKSGSKLELLHIIDQHPEISKSEDRSGAIGIDASEQLLQTLTEQDALINREAREKGRHFLSSLRERMTDAGVPTTDIRQRYGSLIETVTEQENEVDLFVLGRRGESADRTRRDLGRNVEAVVRSLNKPILTVTEAFVAPKSVLIAFDGSAITRQGVKKVATSPLFRGLKINVLMSGSRGKAKPKRLEWAEKILKDADLDVSTFLILGDAEDVIARFVSEHGIDILIMGAYSHSPLRSFFFGSKTADLLRSTKIPTILLR